MHLRFSGSFNRQFGRLSRDQQERVLATIDFFRHDPHHPDLRNHDLHERYAGFFSVAADHDLRIMFREKDNYAEVTMLQVGDHSIYL